MNTHDSDSPAKEPCLDEAEVLTITDAIPIGITVLEADGTILYVNRVGLERLGLTLAEVKGEPILLGQHCHADDPVRVAEERRAGLSKGVPFELEMRSVCKDRGYRWHLFQYN